MHRAQRLSKEQEDWRYTKETAVGASIQAAEHLQSCPFPVSASSRSTVLPLHGAGTCAAGQQQQQTHWFNSQTGLPNLCSFLLHMDRGKYLGVIPRNRWIPVATHVEPTYLSKITRNLNSINRLCSSISARHLIIIQVLTED